MFMGFFSWSSSSDIFDTSVQESALYHEAYPIEFVFCECPMFHIGQYIIMNEDLSNPFDVAETSLRKTSTDYGSFLCKKKKKKI